MKNFTIIFVVCSALFVSGCQSQPVREATPESKILNDPKLSGNARDAVKQGMDNASITQQVMKTHRLPNGQPIPTGPGPEQPGAH
jgi:hypothetical protein